ncbi:MAG: hypothetical protein N2253_08115 [Bacteroidia bacterium]|nr:hypothetical protein [Bacteroidia bacterium]MCX7764839.1 hypothetical protein [Bacteroidia bacterium]MDW8057919.1 hypothetical protein [Bacteroidia bacterium]
MRFLLIETSDNHHETLLSLIAYAKLQPFPTKVYVAAPPAYESLYASLGEVDGFFSLAQDGQALNEWIKAMGIEVIFHNTAYGHAVWKLMRRLPPLPQVGIIHDTEKLHRPSWLGWQIAWKLKKFFVLREKLQKDLPSFWRKKAHTLHLAELPLSLWQKLPPISKPAGEKWFAIPGRIELKRRAYLDLIHELVKGDIAPEWKFLLLGPAEAAYSDWPRIQNELRRYGLLSAFKVFPQGLSFPAYHAYLRVCEGILPLIHPGIPYFSKYLRYQITGAFSLAFIHRKPLFLHEAFALEEDLQDAAFFYSSPSQLIELLRAYPECPLYQKQFWKESSLTLGAVLREVWGRG